MSKNVGLKGSNTGKSKTKSDSKDEETEDSWVFDSLVGFLRGPVWWVPVMTFIEQKSLSKLFLNMFIMGLFVEC